MLARIIEALPEGLPFDDEPPIEPDTLNYEPISKLRKVDGVPAKPAPAEVIADNDYGYGDWQGAKDAT